MKSCTEAGKSLRITQWCGARNLRDKLHAFLISPFNFIDFPLPVHLSLSLSFPLRTSLSRRRRCRQQV